MTTARPTLPPRFDALDPALLDDPYPAYARLRDASPLCRGGPGQWVVSRYDEVAALLRDPRLTKTLPEDYYRLSVSDPDVSSFLARQNLGRRNRRASRLLAKAFRPALARALADHIADLVDGLLAGPLERGRVDVVADLARPLPLAVICELLGIPEGDRTEVWPRAAALVDAFSDAAFLGGGDAGASGGALRWLTDYVGALLAARRRDPRADLLSAMLAVDEDGERLSDEEIVDNAITVFYAGFETSMGLISNGIVALLHNPDELARLRGRRAQVPAAVDELLRYEAPIQVTMRAALEPIGVGGRTVRPGRVLLLLLGSANRDERRFADPDRLDVGREPNPHVSFGAGVYYCLGAVLAKAEGEGVLERLLARTVSLELDGEPVRRPRFNFRSYERVDVALVAR